MVCTTSIFDNIPSTLRELPQWVCVESHSKVPMQAHRNVPASSVKPETWATFEEAVKSIEDGHYDNLGFVFANNNLVGIDIDEGYDEDGFLSTLAAEIIGTCQSYTERSRSGRGFHILLVGDLPFSGRNNLKGVEIYKSGRYFIMTGDTVVYDQLLENQTAIDYVIDKYFPDIPRITASNDFSAGSRLYCPIWERPENGRIKLRPIYPRIPNGCRNICLTSLAGMLHSQGYSRDQIYDELIYANETACEPTLDRREIKSIVSSVTRYKR